MGSIPSGVALVKNICGEHLVSTKSFRLLNTLTLILTIHSCFGQNYHYQKHLSDLKLAGKMYELCNQNKYDSVGFVLPKYENRLGYRYYFYRAIVEQLRGSENQIKYLDTAFQRGLHLKCMSKHLLLFDSFSVRRSFELNYLVAYDKEYIHELQQMETFDQKYRGSIVKYEGKLRTDKHRKDGSYNRDTINYTLEQKEIKKTIDSLRELQDELDSLNFLRLKELIAQKGWPSAHLIGLTDCFWSRAPSSPHLIMMHLGTQKREYQVSILQQVLALCTQNKESWTNAESLIFNLYNRFRHDFTEFSFLQFDREELDEVKSFFPVYQMTSLLIKKPTEAIEIKCNSLSTFNSIKQYMLQLNRQIDISGLQRLYRERGLQEPKHLTDSRFRFVLDNGYPTEKAFYRFIAL